MPSPKLWTKIWAVWTTSFTLTGVAFDLCAYIFGGYDCTLTCHVRTWAQIEQNGKFARLGRTGVVGFLLWAALHLGWGVLDPIPRRFSPVLGRIPSGSDT